MSSSHSLDVILSQCKRFEFAPYQVKAVKSVYDNVYSAHVYVHIGARTSADDAVRHHHKAQEKAYKRAAETICSIIDREQSQADGGK